jgi:hypothetical protein
VTNGHQKVDILHCPPCLENGLFFPGIAENKFLVQLLDDSKQGVSTKRQGSPTANLIKGFKKSVVTPANPGEYFGYGMFVGRKRETIS